MMNTKLVSNRLVCFMGQTYSSRIHAGHSEVYKGLPGSQARGEGLAGPSLLGGTPQLLVERTGREPGSQLYLIFCGCCISFQHFLRASTGVHAMCDAPVRVTL